PGSCRGHGRGAEPRRFRHRSLRKLGQRVADEGVDPARTGGRGQQVLRARSRGSPKPRGRGWLGGDAAREHHPHVDTCQERAIVLRSACVAANDVLTPEARDFVTRLHRELNPTRLQLLERRLERQRSLDAGELPDFLDETRAMRDGSWRVAGPPADLLDRRCEITGPVDRKMMINALNSGARVFMADFEDACSPTWQNVLEGQANLREAVRGTIRLETAEKTYALREETATLIVRPRGWHLPERHLLVDGEAVSASLFDFGLAFFHNAREQLQRGSGPYFYLPKLESHREARLWAQAFALAEEELGVPRGSIRCTV